MKEFKGKLQYKNKEYDLVFDLNVMEQIQDEYGTLEKWAELTDGNQVALDENGEPLLDENGMQRLLPKEVDAKALKFGIWCMINEGIDIKNEDEGTDQKPVTKNQVGRMLSAYGMEEATAIANNVVIESSGADEKNA